MQALGSLRRTRPSSLPCQSVFPVGAEILCGVDSLRITSALLAGSKPALASCSQVAAGGDRWLLMVFGGISGARP
jgi:hypothetical protein